MVNHCFHYGGDFFNRNVWGLKFSGIKQKSTSRKFKRTYANEFKTDTFRYEHVLQVSNLQPYLSKKLSPWYSWFTHLPLSYQWLRFSVSTYQNQFRRQWYNYRREIMEGKCVFWVFWRNLGTYLEWKVE